MSKPWYVYILSCADTSYYTGITTDVPSRVNSHNSGKGCKFTAGRLPVKLLYCELHPDNSSARKREMEIKAWGRKKKEELVRGSPHPAARDSG